MDWANPHLTHNICIILYEGYSYYLCMHTESVTQVHFQYHMKVVFMISAGDPVFIFCDLKCLEYNSYLQCSTIDNFHCIRPLMKIYLHQK